MSSIEKAILLAGTRITGDTPHLGTYLGWIDPLVKASVQVNVVVLLADLQSLEVPDRSKESLTEHTIRLKNHLRTLLPGNIPIIVESTLPGLCTLGWRLLRYFSDGDFKRISPLRKAARVNDLTIPTCLYPSLMLANILAFRATHILSKPEGHFQHIDVLNDVLRRLEHRAQLSIHLQPWPKARFDIPRLDGHGPMKRTSGDHNCLLVTDRTPSSIATKILRVSSRPAPHTRSRAAWCSVVPKLWEAVSLEAWKANEAACTSGELTCETCCGQLGEAIASLFMNRGTADEPLAESIVLANAVEEIRRLAAIL